MTLKPVQVRTMLSAANAGKVMIPLLAMTALIDWLVRMESVEASRQVPILTLPSSPCMTRFEQ
jgi:hypothetical protein